MADKATQTPASLGIARAQRHAFLCIGPDCCTEKEGAASWETLKAELKQAGAPVLRTKAACLRLCHDGPWMVVYPEGVWYNRVTPDICREIAQTHLIGGKILEHRVAARKVGDCQES